jgi:hypothetical protein
MADLATQVIDQDGVIPSYSAAAVGGDKFVPGDNVFLHIKNGGGGSQTVTIATPKEVDGLAVADVAVPVSNGVEKMIGPLTKRLFADPADSGKGAITYTGVTSVTVAILELS